ncbi:MAG: Ig-like domain-containing protein, partial [Lachnospiraceae bacterium]
KKLKKGTSYKYYVKACKTEEGKTVTISTSYKIYVVTTGGKYSNQGTFTVSPTSCSLSVGATKQLKVSYKTGGKLRKFTSYIRYQSSDTAVASVSSSGKITAKKKGTCYIYIYGQNGYKTRAKVTVTD